MIEVYSETNDEQVISAYALQNAKGDVKLRTGSTFEICTSMLDSSIFLSNQDILTTSELVKFTLHSAESLKVSGGRGRTSSTKTKMQKHKVNMFNQRQLYRRRLKAEREELKRMAGELSKKLIQLKHSKLREKAALDASRTPAYFFWKACATRQKKARLLVEAENRKLTAAFQTQAKYIQALQGISTPDVDKCSVEHEQEEMIKPPMMSKGRTLDELHKTLVELDITLPQDEDVVAVRKASLNANLKSQPTAHFPQCDEFDSEGENVQALPCLPIETEHFLWEAGHFCNPDTALSLSHLSF